MGDVRAQNQQRGGVFNSYRFSQGSLQSIQIFAGFAELVGVPAIGREAFDRIIGKPLVSGAVYGDAVVVVYVYQAAET